MARSGAAARGFAGRIIEDVCARLCRCCRRRLILAAAALAAPVPAAAAAPHLTLEEHLPHQGPGREHAARPGHRRRPERHRRHRQLPAHDPQRGQDHDPDAQLRRAATCLAELKDTKNVALVLVTATIPAMGARQGDKIDAVVSSIGSAKSLAGGRLFLTPLIGPDPRNPRVYAFAEGPLTLENPATSRPPAASTTAAGWKRISSTSSPRTTRSRWCWRSTMPTSRWPRTSPS